MAATELQMMVGLLTVSGFEPILDTGEQQVWLRHDDGVRVVLTPLATSRGEVEAELLIGSKVRVVCSYAKLRAALPLSPVDFVIGLPVVSV